MSVLDGLEPKELWRRFGELSAIPRPSKEEEKVLVWLKKIAEENKLQWEQDSVGNMVIRRPGSSGGENAPPIVIQGHVDMVTEKNNDINHDFSKDPISLMREGDWITAKGTTLGADNGIGVAAALALLTMPTTTKLPPLECLFTVDEETGLTGAKQLKGEMIKGKTMLNLDTEEWGSVYMGCSGGGDSLIRMPLTTLQTSSLKAGEWQWYEVKCGGLKGGHSGLDIASGRGNSIRLLARALEKVVTAHQAKLSLMRGGNKRNALARECTAHIALPASSKAKSLALLTKSFGSYQHEYKTAEPTLSFSCEPLPSNQHPAGFLGEKSADALLCLLTNLPHGVMRMSTDKEGLVETSSNMATVELDLTKESKAEPHVEIVCSSRSSLSHALEDVRASIATLCKVCGAEVEQPESYPGWHPNPESKVLKVTKECYKELTGKEAEEVAIHAGLECGIINERCNGVDTVSFGPTIKGAHSPDERVQISTVKPFYDLVLRVLARLAG
uniref:Peptidase M20 dimerisation domain-containing protein n=1 Tax=Lotharella oceanica TaxID=641309 RepID=A0A7S2U1B6_9EUKA|mmetsp:Transcript_512/g.985  ORF Transcript_512/g.985 Transcript_512/m.985 type:complete len:500 (+) Transcript_512:2-1501(+)